MALPLMKRVNSLLRCLILPFFAIAIPTQTIQAQSTDAVADPNIGSTPSSPAPSSPAPSSPAPSPRTQPTLTTVQASEPMDFLDPPEGTINCIVTGTTNAVPWDNRFTYWLSGLAQFDEEGNMLPIPPTHTKDWLLTVTNSRFSAPASFPLVTLNRQVGNVQFAFPPVSPEEWETMGKRPSRSYTTAFSYEESHHGLYIAIRNSQSVSSVRQLMQVIHYLAEDVAIVSDAAPCFIGPRPPSPLEFSTP